MGEGGSKSERECGNYDSSRPERGPNPERSGHETVCYNRGYDHGSRTEPGSLALEGMEAAACRIRQGDLDAYNRGMADGIRDPQYEAVHREIQRETDAQRERRYRQYSRDERT